MAAPAYGAETRAAGDEIGIANAMEIGRKLAKVVLAFQTANK